MAGLSKALAALTIFLVFTAFSACVAMPGDNGRSSNPAEPSPVNPSTPTVLPVTEPTQASPSLTAELHSFTMADLEQSDKDNMATLAGLSEASIATSLLKAAGLGGIVSNGEFTLFVPSDGAIGSLGIGADQLSSLEHDQGRAMAVAQGFVMPGSMVPTEFDLNRTAEFAMTTMNGKTLSVKEIRGRMVIGGANVTRAVQTSNGIIYVIDAVPASMAESMSQSEQ